MQDKNSSEYNNADMRADVECPLPQANYRTRLKEYSNCSSFIPDYEVILPQSQRDGVALACINLYPQNNMVTDLRNSLSTSGPRVLSLDLKEQPPSCEGSPCVPTVTSLAP